MGALGYGRQILHPSDPSSDRGRGVPFPLPPPSSPHRKGQVKSFTMAMHATKQRRVTLGVRADKCYLLEGKVNARSMLPVKNRQRCSRRILLLLRTRPRARAFRSHCQRDRIRG
jgi:hypothetical protein